MTTIYHNPRCSKSRATLALLEERGVAADVVLYLEAKDRGRWPLAVIHEVEISPRDNKVRTVVLRYKGALYRRSINSILLLQAMEIEGAADSLAASDSLRQ